MKYLLSIALVLGSVGAASAQYYGYGTGSNSDSHSVSGYVNNRGTYVDSYQRTSPNSTQYDNYSTRGNYNSYSGSYGTRSPRW